MAYASFRCQVAAPVSAIWKSLVRIHAGHLDPDEEAFVDSTRREIVVRFRGAAAPRGERRLAIRSIEDGAMPTVESILDWDTGNTKWEPGEIENRVDRLVRELPLEVKRNAEAS